MALGVGTQIAAFTIYAAYYKKQVDALADDLESGKITVDEWEARMQQELAKLHTTAFMIGIGGVANATAANLAELAAIIAAQTRFLARWASELRKEAKHKASKIKSRAMLYLNAANATLLIALTSALGMPRLPAYPGDGTTECMVNDKCTWEFYQVAGGWDCYWTLHPAEHCPTCLKRAQVWNPLRIRNGVIQNPGGVGLFAS